MLMHRVFDLGHRNRCFMLTRSQAIAVVAVPLLARARPVAAQSMVTVRMGAGPTDSFAEPLFALDAGFFKRAGLAVELNLSPALMPALVGGAIDVSLGDVIQIANPVNAGVDLASFAGAGLYTSAAPTTLFCAAKNGPIRVAKDLEGQAIGIVLVASLSDMAVREWMRRNGADLDKVRMIEMPFATMAPALQRGTVAAVMLPEPFLSDARNDVRVLGNAYEAIAASFYISIFMATRTWLTANPDVAKRVQQALYDTARWANTHRDETATILAKYARLDVERVHAMTRSTFATSLDEGRLQPVLDIAFRYKRLAKPVNAADLIARI
jgi:NitT/TauT family transport system substrate-binding protein